MIGPFRRRSSWPSSFATALIGWIGFSIVVPLAVGYTGALGQIFGAAALCAIGQVVVLRFSFRWLKLDQSIRAGLSWGAISGGALIAVVTAFPVVRTHPVIALIIGGYTGAAVGIFLSYFHRDDRKIESEAVAAGSAVDYGRDAHWLDPFVYGAIAYEVAVRPRTSEAAISVAVVGMMTGVVAAGVSHFFLSYWNNRAATLALAAIAGGGLGAATGLLLRNYAADMPLAPVTASALGGALTFLITAAVGRRLAIRESNGAAAAEQV
jgi:hypothetical protein